jgi:hypothetical protein
LAPDATITGTYAENPATEALFRDRFWRFMDDPSALASLWIPGFRAVAIGWTIHRQGGGYLQSGYYCEIEAPLDSCWILSGMIGDSGTSIAHSIPGVGSFVEVSPQQVLWRFNGFLNSVILRVNEARDLGDVNRFQFYLHSRAARCATRR